MFRANGWPGASRELDQYQKKLGRDLKGTEPWCVQIKNSERANPIKALMEAEAEVNNLYPYAISFVKSGGRWVVTMSSDAFFWLIDQTPEGGPQ